MKTSPGENKRRLKSLFNMLGLPALQDSDFKADGGLRKSGQAYHTFSRLEIAAKTGKDAPEAQDFIKYVEIVNNEGNKGLKPGAKKSKLFGFGNPDESDGESAMGSGKRMRSVSPAKPWLVKGSQAAKDRMAELRAKRKKKE